jgi:hypothetical protein
MKASFDPNSRYRYRNDGSDLEWDSDGGFQLVVFSTKDTFGYNKPGVILR